MHGGTSAIGDHPVLDPARVKRPCSPTLKAIRPQRAGDAAKRGNGAVNGA
jgi:hypothetical protein